MSEDIKNEPQKTAAEDTPSNPEAPNGLDTPDTEVKPRSHVLRVNEGGGVVYSVRELMKDPAVKKSFDEADEFLREQLARQAGR